MVGQVLEGKPVSSAIYVITLDPDSSRVQELLGQLREQGLTGEIFRGVDGRGGMPALRPEERFCRWKALARHKRWLTSSEVGCYLSHLRAIRRAWEAGHDRVCILEDDVVLEPGFAQVLTELGGDPELELVRFMALRLRPRTVVRPLADRYRLVRPKRGTVGTQGYQLNRAGMARLLAHGSCLYEPIDKVMDHFWLYGLKTFLVEPHLIWERPSPSFVQRPATPSRDPSWLQRVIHPLFKLYHSLRRHLYLLVHRREFAAASLPDSSVGKTPRLH
ncbi:hypothetical protein GCM10027428_12550 [Haliea atlantica]